MQAIACLPEERAAALSRVAEQERIEELRLRCGEAPSVRIGGAERPLSLAPVTADELRETVSRAARYSVHSYAESMRQGFLPLEGGHRLGLCGTAVAENGSVTGVRRISSLNLRVARQIDALDDILAPYIGEGAPFSLLVLAPPAAARRRSCASGCGSFRTPGTLQPLRTSAARSQALPRACRSSVSGAVRTSWRDARKSRRRSCC